MMREHFYTCGLDVEIQTTDHGNYGGAIDSISIKFIPCGISRSDYVKNSHYIGPAWGRFLPNAAKFYHIIYEHLVDTIL